MSQYNPFTSEELDFIIESKEKGLLTPTQEKTLKERLAGIEAAEQSEENINLVEKADPNLTGSRLVVKNLNVDQEGGVDWLKRKHPDYDFRLADNRVAYKKKGRDDRWHALDPDTSAYGFSAEGIKELGRDIGDIGGDIVQGVAEHGAGLLAALGGGATTGGVGAVPAYIGGVAAGAAGAEALKRSVAEALGVSDKPISEHLKEGAINTAVSAASIPVMNTLFKAGRGIVKAGLSKTSGYMDDYVKSSKNKILSLLPDKRTFDRGKFTGAITDTDRLASKEVAESVGLKSNPMKAATNRLEELGRNTGNYRETAAQALKTGQEGGANTAKIMDIADNVLKRNGRHSKINIKDIVDDVIKEEKVAMGTAKTDEALEKSLKEVKEDLLGKNIDTVKETLDDIFLDKVGTKLIMLEDVPTKSSLKIARSYRDDFLNNFDIKKTSDLKKITPEKIDKFFDNLVSIDQPTPVLNGLNSARKSIKTELADLKNIQDEKVSLKTLDNIKKVIYNKMDTPGYTESKFKKRILEKIRRNIKKVRDEGLGIITNNKKLNKEVINEMRRRGIKIYGNTLDTFNKHNLDYRMFATPDAKKVLQKVEMVDPFKINTLMLGGAGAGVDSRLAQMALELGKSVSYPVSRLTEYGLNRSVAGLPKGGTILKSLVRGGTKQDLQDAGQDYTREKIGGSYGRRATIAK